VRAGALALALAAWALLAPAAGAGAARVDVRVEGPRSTLIERPVRVAPGALDGGDGSGAHPCSGPLGEPPRPSALGALDAAAAKAGVAWRGTWMPAFADFFLTRIGPWEADAETGKYWTILRNERITGGGCSTPVRAGDRVVLAYGMLWRPYVLRLRGPERARRCEPFTVRVRAVSLDPAADPRVRPLAGVRVRRARTDRRGRATLVARRRGTAVLKARHTEAIPSNALALRVGAAKRPCRGP
jgi:hypothetical protein